MCHSFCQRDGEEDFPSTLAFISAVEMKGSFNAFAVTKRMEAARMWLTDKILNFTKPNPFTKYRNINSSNGSINFSIIFLKKNKQKKPHICLN